MSDMIVIAAGEITQDRWVHVNDEAAPPDGPALVSLHRLTRDEALCHHRAGLGVRLPPATDLAAMAPLLPRLELVAIEFPKFRDGRGFSLARALRERFGFSGEIRAFGHLLPDQYLFLTRCGVDSVALPAGTDLAPWRQALLQFQVAYQPAANDSKPLSPLRRTLAVLHQAGG